MPNSYETWEKWLPHELSIFPKFHRDWAKIVDLLLMANLWASVIFFESVYTYVILWNTQNKIYLYTCSILNPLFSFCSSRGKAHFSDFNKSGIPSKKLKYISHKTDVTPIYLLDKQSYLCWSKNAKSSSNMMFALDQSHI